MPCTNCDTTIVEETDVYPILVKLAACLCSELDSRGVGGQCFCGVKFGGTVAWDSCECNTGKKCGGMAWVRLVQSFPSTAFPQPDNSVNCFDNEAHRIEVAVIGCVPTMDARGNLPSMDDELEAARRHLAYKAAMRAAIKCCFLSFDEEVQVFVENYTPFENQGGCGGGTYSIIVGR